MTIRNNFPTLKPSLLLDFANVKRLDPRVTFTRASTATYYDGSTESVAEQNMLRHSQGFATSGVTWFPEKLTITSDTTAAPDGTTTADTITNTATAGIHEVHASSVRLDAGLPYTYSVYVKKNLSDFVQLTQGNGTLSSRANFNILTGALGTVDGGTSAITSVGNGWYRCSWTFTAPATDASVAFYIVIITGATAVRFESYTGTTSQSIYVWGAQLEQRSAVSVYTPTTTAPVTNLVPTLLTASSGTPRFNHNPITGESLGLLIEEGRRNLMLRSEEFDNASWIKFFASITGNTIVSPGGTLSGDKLVEDATLNVHRIEQGISLISGNSYTLSLYAKSDGSNRQLVLYFPVAGFGTGTNSVFNLSNGSITNTEAGTETITDVGNGWYRCTVTRIATVTATIYYQIRTRNPSAADLSYTGDGYSGVYIWGAQLEAATFATSYIPTAASFADRAVESATMTGTNFSSWYRGDEGTMCIDLNMLGLNPSGVSAIASLEATVDTAIGFQRFRAGTVITGLDYYVEALGATSVDTSSYGITPNTFYKLNYAYKANSFAVSRDGGTQINDNTGAVPPFADRFVVAKDLFNGHIKRIAYYPLRVTDAQLVVLSR